jgi:hypothetical protein
VSFAENKRKKVVCLWTEKCPFRGQPILLGLLQRRPFSGGVKKKNIRFLPKKAKIGLLKLSEYSILMTLNFKEKDEGLFFGFATNY